MAWYNSLFMPTRLSPEDIQNIRLSLQPDFQEIRDTIEILQKDSQKVQKILDTLVHTGEKQKQEWTVLRAQHIAMRESLLRNKMVSEQDLQIQ